jgi:hypothetical protein
MRHLILTLVCSLVLATCVAVARAEEVGELWRGGFYLPGCVSVNPTDGDDVAELIVRERRENASPAAGSPYRLSLYTVRGEGLAKMLEVADEFP